MQDLIIRFARAGDGPVIYDFIQQLAEYEREPDAVKNTPQALDEQLGQATPPFECLLAEDHHGVPLGFALFFHTYSTWEGVSGIHLEDFFVVPAARRLGIGHALFERLAQITLERGCARLEWSVLRWNQLALDFYQSLGAETLNEWHTQRLSASQLRKVANLKGRKADPN